MGSRTRLERRHPARRHGIEDRLILTAVEPYLPAVGDEVLNWIFNACDVGINTSVGEGWGLVNLEHAATGAAQVVPRHSACEELWTGSALLLEPCMSLTSERILTEGKIVSPERSPAPSKRSTRMRSCAPGCRRRRAGSPRPDYSGPPSPRSGTGCSARS